MITNVLGVDPGPTPGIVRLTCTDRVLTHVVVLQVSANALYLVLDAVDTPETHLAVERFVPRGRLTADQRLTQTQASNLNSRPHAVLNSAAMVKPWATDARLEAAGLLPALKGMRHARDAARHALFHAVKSEVLPDPLSKTWTR